MGVSFILRLEREFEDTANIKFLALHFKLAMAHGHTGDTYEETQVTYRPQLDAGRDGELMEILPDYLVEEITFPLHQAAKFYSRVTRSLTDG